MSDSAAAMMERFWHYVASIEKPTILDIGGRNGNMRDQVLAANPNSIHISVDVFAGPCVDVVADVHQLSKSFAPASVDGWLCGFSLEHFNRPWIAAQELAKVTRAGGLGWIGSHQTFPLHYYPCDYFRFSTHGLWELFNPDEGWQTLMSGYEYPCSVVPHTPTPVWQENHQAYLNVNALVQRM